MNCFKKGAIKRTIDHIVYTVSNLDRAILEFEEKLGIRPVFGGYHPYQGTKNALINLNDECYLELLAADNTNTIIPSPRWMGVDVLTKNQITRFALKSDSLEKDSKILNHYDSHMGTISEGSRNTADGVLLEWQLIIPLATPEVEVAPFMIDWSKSQIHPSSFLPDMKCTLIELYATHPNPKKLKVLYETLGFKMQIKEDKEIRLKMKLNTPNGSIIL